MVSIGFQLWWTSECQAHQLVSFQHVRHTNLFHLASSCGTHRIGNELGTAVPLPSPFPSPLAFLPPLSPSLPLTFPLAFPHASPLSPSPSHSRPGSPSLSLSLCVSIVSLFLTLNPWTEASGQAVRSGRLCWRRPPRGSSDLSWREGSSAPRQAASRMMCTAEKVKVGR